MDDKTKAYVDAAQARFSALLALTGALSLPGSVERTQKINSAQRKVNSTTAEYDKAHADLVPPETEKTQTVEAQSEADKTEPKTEATPLTQKAPEAPGSKDNGPGASSPTPASTSGTAEVPAASSSTGSKNPAAR